MRVLIVCPGWPGNVNPWNGIFVREQAEAIDKEGTSATVLTARVFRADPYEAIDGRVKVFRFWFPSKQILLAEYERIPVFRIGFYLLSGIFKAFRLVKKESCDVIHAHFVIPAGLIAVIAGRLRRKPVVITAHDSDVVTFPEKSKIAGWLIGYSLRQADHIIPTNIHLKDHIATHFGIEEDKMTVIPLGIDRGLFRPIEKEEARRKLDLSLNRRIILYVGALLQIKGVDIMPDIVSRVSSKIRDPLFVFVGAGPLKDALNGEFERRGEAGNVVFEGSKAHEALPLWYNAADLMVLPTTSEGLGMVVREAISSGLPVVASGVGGIPDVVKEGKTGYLTQPGDADGVSQAILKVLGDEGFRDTVAKHSSLIDPFDHQKIAGRVIDVYKRIS